MKFQPDSYCTFQALLVAFSLYGSGCEKQSIRTSQAAEIRGTPILTLSERVSPSSISPLEGLTAVGEDRVEERSPEDATPVPLGFDRLSNYTFEVTDELLGPVTNDLETAREQTESQIPKAVHSYNQKRVALRGFMLPLKVEGGLVTEMLIMKDQSMCCYGTTPRINDWVSVKMQGKGVRPLMDMPVTMFGTFSVGEMRENGYLVGIYSMEGEALQKAEDEP